MQNIIDQLKALKINNYVFGDRSERCLNTVHKDMELIHRVGLMTCRVDYGVIEGSRTFERQFELYMKGRKKNADGSFTKIGRTVTRVNPYKYSPKKALTKGKHLVNEFRKKSMATDIIAVVPGRKDLIFDKIHLAYISAHLVAVSHMLYALGMTTHLLRWGGNWDKDGTLIVDQSLNDMPHTELYLP